jgi:arabinose-5-phosphate isomerase
MESKEIKDRCKEILKIQQDAISNITISDRFVKSVKKIAEIYEKKRNYVITTGMGKAGIIASKMSATLASIGIPSFFVSPAESIHGDIGRIRRGDLLIVFSNSGTTSEVVNMVITLNNLNYGKNYIISIGSSEDPEIPVDLAIGYGDLEESCIVSKVPSTTTTVMLVIADILAITAAESVGLDQDWFKKRHSGGAIGDFYKANKI